MHHSGLKTISVAAALACVSAATLAQVEFVDDALRTVALPARVARVFAGGSPGDILLYTLVPELLVGRNRVVDGAAVEFVPPAYRKPVLIRRLPEAQDPASDAELIALKPDLYIDYGLVDTDYAATVDAVQRRTGVPGILLAGTLSRIPDVYRRLGAALGVVDRGERLARTADRILTTYRGSLNAVTPAPRIYLACSPDGLQPCFEDDRASEVLTWIGGVNVVGTRTSALLRPLSPGEIKTLAPDAIVIPGDRDAVERMRANAAWQAIEAVRLGRVYYWPVLPYSWGARPPSVNRLPGLVWLAYVARGRSFDAAFNADIRALFSDLYHVTLTDRQLQTLTAQ